jgi:hypothetical protein
MPHFAHSRVVVSRGNKLHCCRMSEDEEGGGAHQDVPAEEHPRLSDLHSIDVTLLLSLEALPANDLSRAFLPNYEAEVTSRE